MRIGAKKGVSKVINTMSSQSVLLNEENYEEKRT